MIMLLSSFDATVISCIQSSSVDNKLAARNAWVLSMLTCAFGLLANGHLLCKYGRTKVLCLEVATFNTIIALDRLN